MTFRCHYASKNNLSTIYDLLNILFRHEHLHTLPVCPVSCRLADLCLGLGNTTLVPGLQ